MATVYLAEDVKHKRKVAVKVMRPELAETLGTERFLREVEIAAQLSHPSILPVFDSGSTNGVLWYVMPFVEGESLPAWIRRERQLGVADAVRLAREVAEALAYAHARGIVHRDIKPANILLHSGRALVADFGIARATGGDGATLTKTGLAIGTPQYMSPEQSSGDRDVDGRADVYALGCVLYEMIAGEPPFTGPTMQAVVARSLTERPRPLTATREGLPSKLNAVVDRALAKSPADRYPSATAMAGALAGVEAQLHGGLRGDRTDRSGLHRPGVAGVRNRRAAGPHDAGRTCRPQGIAVVGCCPRWRADWRRRHGADVDGPGGTSPAGWCSARTFRSLAQLAQRGAWRRRRAGGLGHDGHRFRGGRLDAGQHRFEAPRHSAVRKPGKGG